MITQTHRVALSNGRVLQIHEESNGSVGIDTEDTTGDTGYHLITLQPNGGVYLHRHIDPKYIRKFLEDLR